MSADQSSTLLWTYVDRVELPPPDQRIAAFAIDTPRSGDRLPGAGLEINGWVIGRESPVQDIRVVLNGSTGGTFPLDVKRPDVASDYPGFAHAMASGFSFWMPLLEDRLSWRLTPNLTDRFRNPATQLQDFPHRPAHWAGHPRSGSRAGGEGERGDVKRSSGFHITVEAILTDGSSSVLCEIHGRSRYEQHEANEGFRSVAGPDFVIIGTQRGGTTSLHAYLSAHPSVQTAGAKELHFLTDRHVRGRDWYIGQFPVELPLGTITGEATPYALFHPASPQRLHAVAPAAKMIVLLRNPVDRAYSHYLLETFRGHETFSFEEALAAEPARLAGEEPRLLAEPIYVSATHNHASYLSRGDYAPQLERWFDVFPRKQFLILRSEDLYDNTAETFARVTTFLGLSPAPNNPFKAHNRTSGPPLDPAFRKRLSEHFAPSNENLAKLLGWKEAWSPMSGSPRPSHWAGHPLGGGWG